MTKAPEYIVTWPNQKAVLRERRFSCPVAFQNYLREAQASARRVELTVRMKWDGPTRVALEVL